MMHHTLLFSKAWFVALLLLESPAALNAQGGAETIRGQVTSDSGKAIPGADVTVTRAPDRAIKTTTTDAAGRYSVSFEDGTGDYLVSVRAPEWKPVRKRITRMGTDAVLVLDVTLSAEKAVELAPLVVRAQRSKPSRNPEMGAGTGAAEKLADGVPAALGPEQEGDLAAIAATVPGAMLGLAPNQNQITLNGLAFGGAEIPRDARTRTRVSSSTYDPARGGFSGTQIAVELAPGNIFSFRRAHATVDAPQLQFTDPVSDRLGSQFTNLQLSAGGDGELVEDRFYYNMAVQGSRRTSDAISLASAGADVLQLAGISPDSASRLLELLDASGIPSRTGGAPSVRTTNNLSFLGRIDHKPQATRTWGVTGYGKLTRADAVALTPSMTPASSGHTSNSVGSLQGIYSFYFGPNRLNETRSAFTYTVDEGEPYVALPSGRVLVSSEFENRPGGFASVAFGGNGGLEYDRRAWTWETTNETQWNTWGNVHKLKIYLQSRLDGYVRSAGANQFGTFTYQSLEDFAANRPASFSRVLDAPKVEGGAWSGAAAVGDLWRISPTLQVLYGARLEGNRYLWGEPTFNPEILSAFGTRNDHVPNRVHLSPRLGFTWVYSGAKNNWASMTASNLGTRYLGPKGVLRGGIGEFRNLLPAALLADAAVATGLPESARRIRCIGPTVPTPDWTAYAADPAAIPEGCNEVPSAPAFADAAPGVQMFDRSYTAPRSWRGNLAWNSQYKRLGFSVEGVYSLNLNQPSTIDLNFADVPYFTLSEEGNRPVFVRPANIVSATGATAGIDARTTSAFGRVVNHTSDLRSVSRQLTTVLTPDLNFGRYFASLAYTLASTRAEHRGFDGATFGSPLEREWAAGDFDVRHQFQFQAGWSTRNFSLTLFGRLASGAPFTPLVSGDINGDGLANDRAFIFDPAATSDPMLQQGLRSLLDSGPEWSRDCLARQLDQPAERNSCRGPWTQALNARVALSNRLLRTGNRVNVALTLANPLGGLDQLLHGSRDLHGWGTQARPDPALYRVRGFDAAEQRFQYEVNERFGDTRPSRSLVRAPFRITLDVRIDWGTPLPVQQLDRFLRPGRDGRPGPRMSADSLKKRYARNVPDIYAMILQESDSLLLTPEQTEALKAAQASYRAKLDPIWTGLAEYLAALPDRYVASEALKRQEDAIDEGWEISRQEGPTIKGILSPLQTRMLPGMVSTVINAKEKLQIRYFTSG